MIKILWKYKWYIFSLIVLIVAIPIFLNWFINIDVKYPVAKNNEWIGFHSSYLGGILGGIISGSLTLGGVYLTIKNQEDKEYKKELTVRYIYSKRINSELILPIILQHPLEKYFDEGFSEDHKIEVESYIEDCLKNKEEHLEYASFIGVGYFRAFNSYITSCEKLKVYLNHSRLYSIGRNPVEESAKSFVEIKKLFEDLDKMHSDLESQIESLIEK